MSSSLRILGSQGAGIALRGSSERLYLACFGWCFEKHSKLYELSNEPVSDEDSQKFSSLSPDKVCRFVGLQIYTPLWKQLCICFIVIG